MNTSSYLSISQCEQGPRTVLRLAGELDLGSVASLGAVLDHILENAPQVVVVDAAGLRFADCGGLSALLAAHKRLAAHGRQLIIVNMQPAVRRLVTITGLDRVFHLDGPSAHPGRWPQPRT
jgi:anti-sigma B factor antagonist